MSQANSPQGSQVEDTEPGFIMKISELTEEQIHIGLRIKSLNPEHPNLVGTIVEREDRGSETTWWVQWDGESKPTSGFYWNHCDCEVEET